MTRPISRRALLAGAVVSPVLKGARVMAQGRKPHVVVAGAGAFGGWTALFLLRRGARVTLADTWGPGNSRASSGGETRVIRGTHGPDRPYMDLVTRSLALWKEHERRFSRPLFRSTGVLWMAGEKDDFEKASLPLLKEYGFAFEELRTAEAQKRFPQVSFEQVKWVIHEKETGYLLARRACEAVLEAFVAEGGEFRQSSLAPGAVKDGELTSVVTSDGERLTADRYVFACGPWLGRVFPDLLGERIKPSRQEVLFFGTPDRDPRFDEPQLPVWIDNGEKLFYGIPGSERRGFKVAEDTIGPPFDPTSGERTLTAEGLRAARAYLAFRFPLLASAPLLESRVCQYENSPDSHFILDRHPEAGNAWIAGGGSGRGFKHGPAVGERMAAMVLEGKSPEPFFSLARFKL